MCLACLGVLVPAPVAVLVNYVVLLKGIVPGRAEVRAVEEVALRIGSDHGLLEGAVAMRVRLDLSAGGSESRVVLLTAVGVADAWSSGVLSILAP